MKMRINIIAVFVVSALLLSAVNVGAENWFTWSLHLSRYWHIERTFDSYEACIADLKAVCNRPGLICKGAVDFIVIGEPIRDGSYVWEYYCFPETYDPRKTK